LIQVIVKQNLKMKNKISFKEYLLEKKKKKKKYRSRKRGTYMLYPAVGFYHTFSSETNAGDGSGVN
jgi:hypothetical protein